MVVEVSKSGLNSAAMSSPGTVTDAFGILLADHRRIEICFERYAQSRTAAAHRTAIADALDAIRLHLSLDAKVLHPAYREFTPDMLGHSRLVEENIALGKRAEKISLMEPNDPNVEVEMSALIKHIRAHIEGETNVGGVFESLLRGGCEPHMLSRRLQHCRDNHVALGLAAH